MSVRTSNHVIIFLVLAVALVMSLVFPSAVLADDGTPPPEETAEAVSPTPDETAEAVSLPPDETVEAVPPTPDETAEAVSPDEDAADAVPPEESPPASVAEIVEIMEEAGAVLADGNGDPIPLAAEAALGFLTVPDPYIIRGGVTYRFLPVGGCAAFPGDPNCTESTTPIQTAIDFSVGGETVFVDPGTYVEQLVITKDIVLQATAPGVIVKAPAVLTEFFVSSGPNNNYPIVYVNNTANASVIGFTIDGDGNGNSNYRFDGIAYYNAGGTIQGNTILNIINTPFSGSQHGVGIFVYATDGGPHNIIIDDNVIENYQKNGMTVSGNGITAEITNNVVTGAGPTAIIAQNGIQVSGGADALVQGNTVTGNVYTPQNWVSTGVLFFGPGDVEIVDNHLGGNDVNAYITGAGSATVTGNTILNGIWDGVWIDSSGPTTISDNSFSGNAEGVGLWNMTNMSAVHINGNIFAGNGVGVANYDAEDVDATGNFWGCPTGPDDPACDQVTLYVLYDPWLVKNPFLPPVVDKVDDEEKGSKKDFPASLIPVTGGQLTSISCEFETSTLLIGDIKVIFSGLCGYEVLLELLTYETLPASLNDGEALLYGLNIILFEKGVPVDGLPANAKVIISYPVAGVPMKWSSSAVNPWLALEGRQVDDRFEVDVDSGTFILIGN